MNHFLELDEVQTVVDVGSSNSLTVLPGDDVFLIHCGSRNFGVKVCNYWAKIAAGGKPDKDALKRRIKEIKASEPDRRKWKDLIAAAMSDASRRNPNGFLSDDDLCGYLTDMVVAQAYARLNHELIKEAVFGILSKFGGISCSGSVYATHNYVDVAAERPMIRKGAIAAYDGETVVIPFNMAFGTCLAVGKGNPDWNFTAPHGAGRLMSRSAAKKAITMDEFRESMEGVYSTTVCPATIDESPQAYKDPEEILRLIEPTVSVYAGMKSVLNVKATDSDGAPWRK